MAKMLFVIATVVGWVANQLYIDLGYSKQISFDDARCQLLDAPTPVEDLSALGDGHCAFGGGGDLFTAFMHGSTDAKAGAMWLVNATEGTVRQLKITGAAVPKLILHGVYFSQPSRRLFAVNHDMEHGESVEVFDVAADHSLALTHVESVRSPLFQHFALNDVVEGAGRDEFYVTEWLPFGFPRNGKKSSGRTVLEVLQALVFVPINALKLKTTRVFRCKLASGGDGTAAHCAVATTERFAMANGITITPDRRTVFINDVLKGVSVMERQRDGTLQHTGTSFKLAHMVDNLEMTADGDLTAGSIPLPFTSETACEEGLGATRVLDGRTVGCGASPGGLVRVRAAAEGGRSFDEIVEEDQSMHDGSKLSGVSSAVQINEHKVLLGSPHTPGVLLCEV